MATKKTETKAGAARKAANSTVERRSKRRLDPCTQPQAAEAARPGKDEEACDDGVK